jgi:hypothetical protein
MWSTLLLFSLLLAPFSTLGACVNTVESIQGQWTSPPKQVPSGGSVDGPLLGNGDIGVVMAGNADQLSLYIGMNQFWGAAIDGYGHCGYGDAGVKQVGGVTFKTPKLSGASKYQATQDIATASITSSHTSSDNSFTLQTSSFVAATSPVLVTKLTLTGSAGISVNVEVDVWTVDSCGYPTSSGISSDKTSVWVTRSNGSPYQVIYGNITKVAIAGTCFTGSNTPCLQNPTQSSAILATSSITLTVNNPVTLIFGVQTNRDVGWQDPVTPTVSLIRQLATSAMISSLVNTHDAWWTSYWSASCILLPSSDPFPVIQKYWYGAQYLLGISSRAGKIPPGLWGPFVTNDGPNWNGDYTLNYNYQCPFYGVFSSNHPELVLSYFDPILQWVPNGQKMAAQFGCPGVHYPGHIGPWGLEVSSVGDMGQRMMASFAAIHFVNYYYYTQDLAWVNSTGYPFLKQVGAFWECYLKKITVGNSYQYNDENDCVNELCSASNGAIMTNPPVSLALVRFLFQGLIQISQDLNTDSNLQAVWKDIYSHMAPYPTAQGPNGTIFVTGVGQNPSPRGGNPFEVFPIIPGDDAGLLSDPKLLQIGRNTVEYLQSWNDGNGFPQFYPAAVRVNSNPSEFLQQFSGYISKNMFNNLYVVEPGGGLETAGSSIVINEMMLQSYQGAMLFFPFVKTFPNLKSTDAFVFENLRAVGAFIVSATFQNNLVGTIALHSQRGLLARILSPWNGQQFTVQNVQTNTTVQVANEGNGIYSFKTTAHSDYTIVQ